jgi:predicted transcriptional regulator
MSIENYLTSLDRRVLDAIRQPARIRAVAIRVGAREDEVRLILRGLKHFGLAEMHDGRWRVTAHGARRAAA